MSGWDEPGGDKEGISVEGRTDAARWPGLCEEHEAKRESGNAGFESDECVRVEQRIGTNVWCERG